MSASQRRGFSSKNSGSRRHDGFHQRGISRSPACLGLSLEWASVSLTIDGGESLAAGSRTGSQRPSDAGLLAVVSQNAGQGLFSPVSSIRPPALVELLAKERTVSCSCRLIAVPLRPWNPRGRPDI